MTYALTGGLIMMATLLMLFVYFAIFPTMFIFVILYKRIDFGSFEMSEKYMYSVFLTKIKIEKVT